MMLRLPAELMCDDWGQGRSGIPDPLSQVLILLAPTAGGFPRSPRSASVSWMFWNL